MAPPRLLFDLNEAPPEEDIEDRVATACEDSQPQSHLDVDDGGEGDGSTACGLPSPPPTKDDSTGDASTESEPLMPVLDLDAPLSPLDDDEDDDLPRPPDDPDGGRSPGPSHTERMAKTDRSTAVHAEAATVTTPRSHAEADGVEGPVHASQHGVTTSPRTTMSLPDCHGMKTLISPAFSARSSSETGAAARVHDSHMPRRDKPPSVPRDGYGESSQGGSRLAGSPSTSHHERDMRSHPYAMRSEGTPRNNNRRTPRRPMRQVYNGHDQRQLAYNGHDQRQQVNNYSHDQNQRQVYGNGQDQRQQLNNNGRDQRHQVYNNGHDQRQQVYNNGQDQWRQGHHGYRTPEGGQGHGYSAPNRKRQHQHQQGYSSGRPSAGGQYAGEDSYGSRQIPANQQQPLREQQRNVVKPYHPYARGFEASDDRANAGKQARYEHPEQQQQQQHRAYQQHRRNTQSTTGGGPARRHQYYGDPYN
uniref:Uncharacterized protein n=1 Tax=Oryza punctata TaxID=4537 RepID=A0A0E0L322_ORYPU